MTWIATRCGHRDENTAAHKMDVSLLLWSASIISRKLENRALNWWVDHAIGSEHFDSFSLDYRKNDTPMKSVLIVDTPIDTMRTNLLERIRSTKWDLRILLRVVSTSMNRMINIDFRNSKVTFMLLFDTFPVDWFRLSSPTRLLFRFYDIWPVIRLNCSYSRTIFLYYIVQIAEDVVISGFARKVFLFNFMFRIPQLLGVRKMVAVASRRQMVRNSIKFHSTY